ncbi:hypothetical protein ACFOW1_08890 [Parasediminibacterium paludis]|uniref:Uncharacterized protein n=1 Tax=Parasediminibacterium paludis TaxID=908966 RepID=A0ABV8PXJ0_9BACT
MLASVSKERFVLSKLRRGFQRKDLCFQNAGERFKGKIYAFKTLAGVSMERFMLSKRLRVFRWKNIVGESNNNKGGEKSS